MTTPRKRRVQVFCSPTTVLKEIRREACAQPIACEAALALRKLFSEIGVTNEREARREIRRLKKQ